MIIIIFVLCFLVFLHLVEKILERKLPRRPGSTVNESLTIFQFWCYLEAEGVSELDTHVKELAEEGGFFQFVNYEIMNLEHSFHPSAFTHRGILHFNPICALVTIHLRESNRQLYLLLNFVLPSYILANDWLD